MASFKRRWKIKPDLFCYMSGGMTASKYRQKIIDHIKKLYLAYFGCAVGDQDKSGAPRVCYVNCSNRLSYWFAGEKPTCQLLYQWSGENKNISRCYSTINFLAVLVKTRSRDFYFAKYLSCVT